MSKRPKSREETPKEGRRQREALPHRNNMRPRCTKRKGFSIFLHANFAGLAGEQQSKICNI